MLILAGGSVYFGLWFSLWPGDCSWHVSNLEYRNCPDAIKIIVFVPRNGYRTDPNTYKHDFEASYIVQTAVQSTVTGSQLRPVRRPSFGSGRRPTPHDQYELPKSKGPTTITSRRHCWSELACPSSYGSWYHPNLSCSQPQPQCRRQQWHDPPPTTTPPLWTLLTNGTRFLWPRSWSSTGISTGSSCVRLRWACIRTTCSDDEEEEQ